MNIRHTDRAPQCKKHVGPFYGHSLRRVIEPEVTDPSWIVRMTDWWDELTVKDAKIFTALVIAAVFCAALIVLL